MIKHIILILLLSAVSFAQIYERKNIEVVRANDRTLIFTYNEDLSNDTLLFVVKATRSISSPRLIQKESTDITEMKISYFANVSMIEIYLQSQDTEDRDTARHWYDITRVHNGDSTTLFLGWFDIWSNVATRFDGTNLATDGSRFYVAGAFVDSTTADSSLFMWDEDTQSIGTIPYQEYVGTILPDSILYPKDSTSQRTYSDLKYVDKTTAQTIIGQKNFSGTVKVGSDTSMILGYMDGTIRTGIHINQLAGHPYGFNRIFKTVPLNPLNASWSMLTRAGDFTAGGVSDHMVFLGYNQDAELVDLQFGQGMEATYDVDDTTVISEWYSYYLSRPSLPTYSVRPFQVGTFRYGSSAPYRYTSSATIAADAFFLISEGGANMIEFRSQTYGATTTQTGTRYSGTLSNALGNSMMYIQDSLWIFHEKNNFGWLYQGDPSGSARELMRLDNSGIYGHVKISPLGVCDIDFGSPIYGSIDWRNNDTTGVISIYKQTGTNKIFVGGSDGMVTNKLEVANIPSDTVGLGAGQFHLDVYTGVLKYTTPENLILNGSFTDWTGTGKHRTPDGFYINYGDTTNTYIEENPTGQLHAVMAGDLPWVVASSDSADAGGTYGYSYNVTQISGAVLVYNGGNADATLITETGVQSGVTTSIINTNLFAITRGIVGTPCEITIDDLRIWQIGGNIATTIPTIYVPDTTGITDGYTPKYIGGTVVWSPDISTSGSGLFNPDGVTIDTTAGGLARVLPAKVTKWDSVSNKQNADADLTDLADGELTASKVGGVKDADYGDVTVSSGVWSVENNSHDHTNMFDTLAISWGILDTTYTGSLSGWKVPNDITITEISAYTDANTCTFNLEERGETTPNTAGTDVMGSDLVADNNQQETSSFTNANIAKNTWLVPTISATGDVSIFSITIRYIKQ